MSREWKPGDVVLVEGEGSAWIAIVRVSSSAGRPLEFAYGNGGFDYVHDVASGFDARPLVVIDPEDSEAVERLANLLVEIQGQREHLAVWFTDMADALREFANPAPPKPDEPTGLGAVVEDEDGTPWVRCENVDLEPHWYARNKKRDYADIAVVRVLSEGVQP